jgi:hypothetical protein
MAALPRLRSARTSDDTYYVGGAMKQRSSSPARPLVIRHCVAMKLKTFAIATVLALGASGAAMHGGGGDVWLQHGWTRRRGRRRSARHG